MMKMMTMHDTANTRNQPSLASQVQRQQPIRASALAGDITPSMAMLNMSAICAVITTVTVADININYKQII